jgi:hypothetical protein
VKPIAPVRSVRSRRTIGHYPLGDYEEADLSLERSWVLDRGYAAFQEFFYQRISDVCLCSRIWTRIFRGGVQG